MKIFFEAQTQFGKYSDTLILSDDQTYSDEEIDILKKTRVDKWVEYMTNPPFIAGPTPEELAAQSGEIFTGNVSAGTE